ncbi:MAG: ATP-binding protein, partial [Clostridia bacterium]|nr:ATP-binding protein [Clostridia bacterium]
INIEKNAVDILDAGDIVILFGNILDNAIEAAERTEKKIIILNIQKQGEYVSIYMENSFDGKFDSALVTNKSNKQEHGFGLKNVRKIVDKYNGMIKCFSDADMFCCDILLKSQNDIG